MILLTLLTTYFLTFCFLSIFFATLSLCYRCFRFFNVENLFKWMFHFLTTFFTVHFITFCFETCYLRRIFCPRQIFGCLASINLTLVLLCSWWRFTFWRCLTTLRRRSRFDVDNFSGANNSFGNQVILFQVDLIFLWKDQKANLQSIVAYRELNWEIQGNTKLNS